VSELPADPFRAADPLCDLVAEGYLVLDALASTGDDGGRDLVPALTALEADDLRAAVLVAVVER
jgi:hypothetical protein